MERDAGEKIADEMPQHHQEQQDFSRQMDEKRLENPLKNEKREHHQLYGSEINQEDPQESSSSSEASGDATEEPTVAATGSAGSENRTFLLTHAAHLSTAGKAANYPPRPSPEIRIRINKVTPLAAAIESPSSPAEATTTSVNYAAATGNASPPSKPNRKRGVPHVYRDYSHVPDATGYVRKKTGGVTQPFPEKLHEMLEGGNEPSVVSWLPHGRAFLVRKPKDFTSHVMPK
jgi:hypothetical protein